MTFVGFLVSALINPIESSTILETIFSIEELSFRNQITYFVKESQLFHVFTNQLPFSPNNNWTRFILDFSLRNRQLDKHLLTMFIYCYQFFHYRKPSHLNSGLKIISIFLNESCLEM